VAWSSTIRAEAPKKPTVFQVITGGDGSTGEGDEPGRGSLAEGRGDGLGKGGRLLSLMTLTKMPVGLRSSAAREFSLPWKSSISASII
jgi:hypothetical protein